MARPAPAALKAMRILDLLVTDRDEEFTISDLARRTGSSLGSAHAVLAVLEETGYVSRHPTRRTYGLGPALVSAGTAALEQHSAIRMAGEQLPDLAAELAADVVVTAATPAEIVFVSVGGNGSRYGPGFREGERVPLAPPLGFVFMAWAPPDEVEAWLSRARADVDLGRVERGLAAVRDRGYALGLASASRSERISALSLQDDYDLPDVDPDATYDLGMASAPVFDADARVLAAVTASGFSPGITGREVLDIGERVRACATVVTKQTRGRLPF